MSGQSFRFLHAASFHLEESLRGMTDFSEELLEIFAEAPLTSALNVLETAIREEVDFVLLSGDILDPTTAGPRVVTELQNAFSRLAERDINVYWAASRDDLNGGWLRTLEWSDNVRVFASDEVQRWTHCRGDLPLTLVSGRSWHPQQAPRAADFVSESADTAHVVVTSERLDLEGHGHTANYWGFGGSNAAMTPLRSESVAHCPGSPQGFDGSESGPHGCTLVHVDADGSVRTRTMAADAVRWCHERIPVGPGMTRHELRQSIRKRVQLLLADAARPLVVEWALTGDNRFDSIFVESKEQQATLEWLRGEFGAHDPPLWSTSVQMQEPDALPPEWCEEDSILGDYLRIVQQHEQDPEAELQLQDYVEGEPPRELARMLTFDEPSVRQQVLREAAILGADLLRGDESPQD